MYIQYKRLYSSAIFFLWLATICHARQAPVDTSAAEVSLSPAVVDTEQVAPAMPVDTTASSIDADTSAAGLKITGEPARIVPLKKTKSPKGAMIRSLIIPGWGQFYNGKWFKGLVIGGTEIGLITNAVIQNQMAVKAVDQLEKEFYQENRSLSIWWLGAAVLYSITDAFVDAHLYDFDDSPELSMSVKQQKESFEHTPYSIVMMNLTIPLQRF